MHAHTYALFSHLYIDNIHVYCLPFLVTPVLILTFEQIFEKALNTGRVL